MKTGSGADAGNPHHEFSAGTENPIRVNQDKARSLGLLGVISGLRHVRTFSPVVSHTQMKLYLDDAEHVLPTAQYGVVYRRLARQVVAALNGCRFIHAGEAEQRFKHMVFHLLLVIEVC
jgi:hypothetical protein